MRRFITISLHFTLALSLWGQQPSAEPLSVGNADAITTTEWLYATFLLEDGEGHVYKLGSTNYVVLDHPLLGEVYNDFANIYFIKYDRTGKPLLSNYVRGSYFPSSAFTYDGGIRFLGWANDNIAAEDQTLMLGSADYLEFLATYNRDGALQKIVKVWDLQPSQFVFSNAAQDPNDGSIYVYGFNNVPLDVLGHGSIGGQWLDDFLYIIKYDRNLDLQWVFTSGFSPDQNETGYFNNGQLFPMNNGELFISGSWEAIGMGPVIDDETLPSVDNGFGIYAFMLDVNGNKLWTEHGRTVPDGGGVPKGGYRNYFFFVASAESNAAAGKGALAETGDMVMAGVTSTGYFQLGEIEVKFEMGDGYLNQFVCRVAPDGTLKWLVPFETMLFDQSESKGSERFPSAKKGTKSERLQSTFEYDAFDWNKKILYLTAEFQNDSLVVADRIMPKKYHDGIMVTSVDIEEGKANWGYSISADILEINGFDADKYGNPSIMGYSSADQEFEGLGAQGKAGKELTFQLGLDHEGEPLWFNNAYPLDGMYGVYGSDLEVLPDGEVFAAMSSVGAVTMEIADTSLFRDYATTLWLLALTSNAEVSGKVVDSQVAPVYPGMVKAFKSAAKGKSPVADSMILGDDGMYYFKGLYPGSYIFQAVADQQSYPDAVPTYLGDEAVWESVEPLLVGPQENLVSQDIMVIEVAKLTPEDGSGGVYGNVSFEDEGELKGTKGKPVTRARVILVKKAQQVKSTNYGDVVAYIETDEEGNYVFENIPDGEYTLVIDIPGLPMLQSYDVMIVGNKLFGLDFSVSEKGITTSGVVSTPTLELEQFLLFPNPGNGHILMKLLDAGNYTVGIFSTDGKMVKSREINSAAGLVDLDISDLNRGIYLIRVDGETASSVTKYVLE